jgi:hypothetical protein
MPEANGPSSEIPPRHSQKKADLNAGSDTSEAASLLIDGHVDADPPQRCRGRQSAHSRANDCNGKLFHVGMP